MIGLWVATWLASAPVCRTDWTEVDGAIRDAAKRADDAFRTRHYEAMQRMHDELEAITKANREAFKKGDR